MFETPILFLIFNRPDATAKVFEAIRKQKPKHLYIAADGPREGKEGEKELCDRTKNIIKQIDWECEVKTLIREENLGCKIAIKTAIDWFFDAEERGIILEDDCLPCESFFGFCEKMLLQYENNNEVMMVSGTNYLFGEYKNDDGYYLSILTPIWGWATWKRAWDKMDVLLEMEDFNMVYKRFHNKEYSDYLINMFMDMKANKINSWAIYWLITIIKNKGLSIIPLKNQISNIGIEGTHTGKIKSPVIMMPTKTVNLKKTKIISDPFKTVQFDKTGIKNILYNIRIDNGYSTTIELLKKRFVDSFLYRKGLFLNLIRKANH